MKPTETVEIKSSKCFTQSKFLKHKSSESGKNVLEDGCITGYIQPSTDQEQTAQETLSAEGNNRSSTDTVDTLCINEIQL